MTLRNPTERQKLIVRGVLRNGNLIGNPKRGNARQALAWIKLVEEELDDPEG